MAQKFVSLDEAATQLGISKDRLNELREDGKVRAYRDGTSWKFRGDDVEKLLADGIPSTDAGGSDISLSLEEITADKPAESSIEISGLSDLDLGGDLEMGSEIGLDLGDEEALPSPAASDLSLDDLDEPTVPVDGPAEGEVLSLDGDEEDDLSDSILLSENELGESTDRPPSTIIGKAEMAADLDLEMSGGDDAAKSDVQLAEPSTSNVFSSGAREAVLDTEPPSLSDNFGDDTFEKLDEIEIDLEAESSRILSPEDVNKAQQAAKKPASPKAPEFSDLELAASDSSPGGVLDGGSAVSDIGLAGLSELELDGDDDDVLGDGSDITLSSESSGINIISPSDSGLALDEVPLAMGSGSPIASGLDLGPTSDDVGLEPLEVAEDGDAEPFALTPFGEEAGEDEEDSSQVIPLDEVSEEESMLGSPRSAAVDAMGDDFAAIPSAGMLPVGEPVGETAFPGWVIGLMSVSMLMLVMCGIMVFDLLRNLWSWDQVYTLNSSLMDVLTPILG